MSQAIGLSPACERPRGARRRRLAVSTLRYEGGAQIDDEFALARDDTLHREATMNAGSGGQDQPLLRQVLLDEVGGSGASTNPIEGGGRHQYAIHAALTRDNAGQ